MKTVVDALRSLAHAARTQVRERAGVGKILRSISWLTFDQVLRTAGALIIAVWIARYLGPEQLGAYSYAMAIIAIFGVLSGSCIDKIVVRNIVQDPAVADSTLGSAMALKLVGAAVALSMAYATASVLRPDDVVIRTMVAIVGVGLLFQAPGVTRLMFEVRVNAKSVVLARNSAFVVAVAVKVILILREAPLVAFAWALLLEAILYALLISLAYRLTGGRIAQWRVRRQQLLGLLRDGWPMLLAAVVTTIYLRIDQLMLGEMINDQAVGIYSVAVRIAEAWYVIPVIIITTVFPSIVRARQRSRDVYIDRLRILYEFLFLLALIVAIVMTVIGDAVIALLFGQEYTGAGPVLAITIWAGIPVFIGAASSQYLVAEGYTRNYFYRTLVGAITNVLLNLLWIPKYGVVGAAFATLVSYTVGFYSLIFFPRTFDHALLMLKSCIPLRLIRLVAAMH